MKLFGAENRCPRYFSIFVLPASLTLSIVKCDEHVQIPDRPYKTAILITSTCKRPYNK